MLRAPFRNGVTDQTCLSGQEYPGLCLVTLVAMKGMLSPAGPAIEKGFYNLIFMALCLEVALTQESYTESQLDQLEMAIKKFLQIFRWVVGPFRECFSHCGLWITKFHGLVHIVFYIRWFGRLSKIGYRVMDWWGTCQCVIRKRWLLHSKFVIK